MKALNIFAMLASVMTVSSAGAMVHQAGTFVPTQCGVQTYTQNPATAPELIEVCLGQVVGQANQAVQLRFVGDNSPIFQVANSVNPLVYLESGNTVDILFMTGTGGATATMRVIKTPNGEIVSAGGTFGQTKFVIPAFQKVFGTM